MIKIYSDGEAFINDNKAYLNENKYLSSFFYIDAPLLKASNQNNYALKVYENNKELLALKVEPYYLMLYGEASLLKELLICIKNNDLDVNGVYASSDIGQSFLSLCNEHLNKEFFIQLAMDFMEAKEITEPSSNEVEKASLDDVDELFICLNNFVIDCGLNDKIKKETIVKNLDSFRIIKKDNVIASLAAYSLESDSSIRITDVYTRPMYRQLGLARKIVNTIKNEIIGTGKIATLNVDQANPISNHLYTSLGFKKVFSRVIVLPKTS